MPRTSTGSQPSDGHEPDWADLFPADPELMASAEGDTKGLAAVKQQARERIARRDPGERSAETE